MRSTALIIFILLLQSCYSYKVFPVEARNFSYQGEKKAAFVLNRDMKKEYGILRHSGIYELTDDSFSNGSVKVRLYPMKRGLSCGQPIIASAITLGQVPVFFPDRYLYRLEEIKGSDTTAKEFELHVATRMWFWDMFTINKQFEEKAGQSLLALYYADAP